MGGPVLSFCLPLAEASTHSFERLAMVDEVASENKKAHTVPFRTKLAFGLGDSPASAVALEHGCSSTVPAAPRAAAAW